MFFIFAELAIFLRWGILAGDVLINMVQIIKGEMHGKKNQNAVYTLRLRDIVKITPSSPPAKLDR